MKRLPVVILVMLVVLVAVVTGCSRAPHYDSRLVAADSLMRALPDSALALVEAVRADSLSSEGDRAYRDLLLTQARYRCYIVATSDSTINRVLNYYSTHSNEREKLTRAYIYKGAVMEELGHPDSAMFYYKHAETVADSYDYFNLGFCNLRIGELYQYHVADADSAVRARMRKAMDCFMACRDTNYIVIAMGNLGSYLYRINNDSARLLLSQAISLARSANLSNQYFYQSKLAGICFYLEDYLQTKALALDIINDGKDVCYENLFYYYAARSFIRMGQMDSAYWVASMIPSPVAPQDSFNHYLLQAELAEAANNMLDYGVYSAKAENIHRRILENTFNSTLLAQELECDVALQLTQQERKYNVRILLIVVLSLLLFVGILVVARKRIDHKKQQFQQELNAAEQEIRKMVEESEKQVTELLTERKKDQARIHQINQQLSRVNRKNRQLEQQHQDAHRLASAIVRERNAALSELYDDVRILIKSGDKVKKPLSLSSLIKGFHENREIRLLAPKASFWKKLKSAVDLEYDGFASFLEKNYPQLTPREQHFCWLVCAGVSPQIIKLCMNYTTAVTVSNNKRRLMKEKLGIDVRFDDFIEMYLNGDLHVK